MRITKYPQSCFMLETADKRILVDPGNLSYEPEFANEWKTADFILVTHMHGDHCHAEIIKNFATPIYSSAEVAAAYPDLEITAVKVGAHLQLADDISIDVVNAIHGWMPFLKHNKAEIHENIGFIVNMEKQKIWFTGDTLCFDNNYKCDILCAPVSGHGLVMGDFELALFAKEADANLVLPCHMDNPKFPVNVENMEKMLQMHEINYKVLGIKETIDL